MGLLRLLLLICAPLLAHDTGHILYLCRTGQIGQAVTEYRAYQHEIGTHDFELLRAMSVVLISNTQFSEEGPDQLLAVFGAGISSDMLLMPVLAAGVYSNFPQVQVAALHFLAQLEDDQADLLLLRAMGSPFLITRLEAGLELAKKRHPETVLQLDTLMTKVPPPVRPLFPQIYAAVGTPEADIALKRLLTDIDPAVRRATVLSLARTARDDFIGDMRRMMCHLDPLQQEVCAHASGLLQDADSFPRLAQLAGAKSEPVRIASLAALVGLGQEEALIPLAELARQGNTYAIMTLGELDGSEDVLSDLIDHPHQEVRINATAALLLRHDPRALPGLAELLITDSRDMGFYVQPSVAGALGAIKAIPSAHHREQQAPGLLEVSQRLKEAILVEALHLPERDFLQVAKLICDNQQNDLIPTIAALLEELQTDRAIALLQQESQHIGAPLIRGYCNLSLFRLGIDGPHKQALESWVKTECKERIIQLRPMVPWDKQNFCPSPYTMTPEETSRLLIESIEAIAKQQDTMAVDTLLDTLVEGNPQNRPPIAGLLIRIMQ